MIDLFGKYKKLYEAKQLELEELEKEIKDMRIKLANKHKELAEESAYNTNTISAYKKLEEQFSDLQLINKNIEIECNKLQKKCDRAENLRRKNAGALGGYTAKYNSDLKLKDEELSKLREIITKLEQENRKLKLPPVTMSEIRRGRRRTN